MNNNNNKNDRQDLIEFKSQNSPIVSADTFHAEVKERKKISETILERKIGMMQRLFPTEEQKHIVAYKTKMLEQQASANLEKDRMYNEFFIQAIKEALDSVLERGKEKSRRERAKWSAIYKSELDTEISNLTQQYFSKMESMEQEILKTKSSGIRERKLRMLCDRLDEFEETIKILMKRYQAVVKEGV